jgi:hypothetical protein
MLSVTRPNAIKVLGWYYTPEEASKARERMPRARRGHEIADMAVTTYERLLRGEYMQAGRLKACPTMKEQSLYTASKKQKKLAERFAMEAEETSARKANLLVEKSKRFIDKSKKTDLSPSEKQELANMLTALKKAGIEIPEACDIGKEKCFVVVIMSIKQKHECLFTPHGNKTKMSNLPKSCLVAKILHKYNRKPEADEDAAKITAALHGQDMEVMAMSKDEFYKLRSQGYTLVG